MTDEEREIQKAIGTYPKDECALCHKQFFMDELVNFNSKKEWKFPKRLLCGRCRIMAAFFERTILKND